MASVTADTASEPGPQTFDELVEAIRSRENDLSKSHLKIAERVMADPEAVAFMTISELATAVGVNEATIVRFAAAMGLRGYPGLTRLCRDRLQEQAQLIRRFDHLTELAGGQGSLFERTVAFDQANIARTFAKIDEKVWSSAVSHLADAPRVHVIGLRKLHAPAYLLGYLLRMVREDVEVITASVGSLTDQLRRVRPGDCFVAMAIHRYPVDTVRAQQWAADQRAHVIAITDNPGSPLAKAAHNTILVDASSAHIMRSMTAFTAVVQALAAGVAQVHGREAREQLLEEEELLKSFNVYVDNPD